MSLFLTRPLVEGPPAFVLPRPRFGDDQFVFSAAVYSLPENRFAHQLPDVPRHWFMVWPRRGHPTVGNILGTDPWNNDHWDDDSQGSVFSEEWDVTPFLQIALHQESELVRPRHFPPFLIRKLPFLPRPTWKHVARLLDDRDAAMLQQIRK